MQWWVVGCGLSRGVLDKLTGMLWAISTCPGADSTIFPQECRRGWGEKVARGSRTDRLSGGRVPLWKSQRDTSRLPPPARPTGCRARHPVGEAPALQSGATHVMPKTLAPACSSSGGEGSGYTVPSFPACLTHTHAHRHHPHPSSQVRNIPPAKPKSWWRAHSSALPPTPFQPSPGKPQRDAADAFHQTPRKIPLPLLCGQVAGLPPLPPAGGQGKGWMGLKCGAGAEVSQERK